MPDRQSAEVIIDRKNGGKSEAAARCSSWVAAAALVTRKSKNDVSDQRLCNSLYTIYLYVSRSFFVTFISMSICNEAVKKKTFIKFVKFLAQKKCMWLEVESTFMSSNSAYAVSAYGGHLIKNIWFCVRIAK